MSLHPQDLSTVPEETARVARAAFPKGNPYLTVRDEFGVIYHDQAFAPLFQSTRGRPAESPGFLAQVTAVQFAENLTDRQVADAVRGRIDLKYLLGLELDDPGFDFTILHDFRTRLLEHEAERLLLDELLEVLKAHELIKARGKQRTDSTHVVAAIRDLNRLELAGEVVRNVLNSLAVVAPDWLRAQAPTEWYDRYGKPFSQWRLPRKKAEWAALTQTVAEDGFHLWRMMTQSPHWACFRVIPAVETLRHVWLQQYYVDDGHIHQRKKGNLPPGRQRIISPYDIEARYSKKRSTTWCGYKVHLTETCEDDLPQVITNVETTPSTTQDVSVTETIHEHLEEKELLPEDHLVDAGYVDAGNLAESESDYGVNLLGPTRPDSSWQAKAGEGFDISSFVVDWEQEQVTCPQGCVSAGWFPNQDALGEPVILVRFARSDCRACPTRTKCTRARYESRTVQFRPKERHIALQKARQRQKTSEFWQAYARRSGVEGTVSQGTHRSGLRRARYVGLAKTHLQHVFTAVAINLVRVADWFGETKRSRTRVTRFAALAPAA
jgi:transposase